MLRKSLPDTPALLGTAEEIPLADNSVDAVLVAQAWHWFNPARAIPELARVLRPGGRLGLVWNTRDERLGWVRELGRIIGRDGDPMRDKVTLPEPFTDVQRHQVEWTNYLTPQALIDWSLAQLLHHLADRVRTKTLDQVRELLATHPALANAGGLALPYVTVCVRATLSEKSTVHVRPASRRTSPGPGRTSAERRSAATGSGRSTATPAGWPRGNSHTRQPNTVAPPGARVLSQLTAADGSPGVSTYHCTSDDCRRHGKAEAPVGTSASAPSSACMIASMRPAPRGKGVDRRGDALGGRRRDRRENI